MALKNTSITFTFYAADILNGGGKTGDSANITLRGVGDGSEFTPATPSITEVDSANCPGLYKATFSTSENNYTVVTCHGKSSTSGVYIQPIQWSNEVTATLATSQIFIKKNT